MGILAIAPQPQFRFRNFSLQRVLSMRLRGVLLCLLSGVVGSGMVADARAAASHARTASRGDFTVEVDTDHPLNRFRPDEALGAGLDGHEQGDTARIYTPTNLRAMASAGLQPLTYRLRTELGIEAWHWNPAGAWSEGAAHQGYWTSAATSTQPLKACYGFRLPRRGTTGDQANNDGYSRLDDGDPTTFWKSNPYLDRHFTGEANTLHPQWIVIDLGRAHLINTAHLQWALPYATHYRVAYWDGADDTGDSDVGQWRDFPGGVVRAGRGGDVWLQLASQPRRARFLRLTMTESCERAPLASSDVRDGLGYALRELAFGTRSQGQFRDVVRHVPNNQQTVIYASSCDPWHRAIDRDAGVEQPGFDTVLRSGLRQGLPILVPVGVLYDTPDNAAAEVKFLAARGVEIRGVELGEEPDGQYVAPADYAALYLQFARALHRVDPHLKLGGPSFQGIATDVLEWPVAPRPLSWLAQVLRDLTSHHARDEFNFCSFEWYPFDDVCAPTEPQLRSLPTLMSEGMQRLRQSGLRPAEPVYMTEYGYSAFAAQPEVEMAGALCDADSIGQFLARGGSAAFFYGYEPQGLLRETPCPHAKPEQGWGNNTLFLADDEGRATQRVAAFYAMQLLTHHWVQPGHGLHTLYAMRCMAESGAKPRTPSLTAYALQRPNGTWSLLVLNKDMTASHWIHVRWKGHNTPQSRGAKSVVNDTLTEDQYGSRQYAWHAAGEHGAPLRNLPPLHRVLAAPETIELPPYSLTVLQGYGAVPVGNYASRQGVKRKTQ